MKCLLLFFCISFTCCYSQEPVAVRPLVLSNVSEQNGLSDDHVQCVLKDKEGFVWIGTSDGLNLMDGSGIQIFRHIDNDTNSLIHNNILCLAEDDKGNIWIGTTDGLSSYQRSQRKFVSFIPPQSPYGAASVINSLVIETSNRVWCSTDGGLFLYEPATKKFTPYYNRSTEQQSNVALINKLHQILLDSRHRLWICSTDGLWTFDPGTGIFKKQIYKNNDPAYHGLFLSVFEDHNKTIWAGNWQNGLKKLDERTGIVSNYMSVPGHPGTISCINELQEPDGKYVLWLNGSLLAFDPAVNKFFHYPDPRSGVEYPSLIPSFRSPDGWMWMASDKGLYIYSPRRQVFRHRFFDSPVTSQGIVFTEWNNELLAGAQGNDFLGIYDSNLTIKKNLSTFLIDRRSESSAALCLEKEKGKENTLWIGSSNGIAIIDLLTHQTKWYRHKDDDSTSLPRDFIAHLFFDSKKQLWVFPWREGVWQMDRETGQFKRRWEGFINGPDHIKRLLIADAVEDDEGNIWMADLDEGIILYEPTTKKFSKPFEKELGPTNNAANIFIQNGFCYASNPSCILKWNPRDRKLKIFPLPPVINKTVYGMVPDKKGNWWLASKNGLIFFNEVQNSFKRYTTVDGLVSNDMNGTLYCKNDGTLLFGMPGYLTSFDPEALATTSGSVSNARLTEVLVNDKPVSWDSTTTLSLDHHSTNLLFRWALPDYASPLKNQYYCQLQGIDTGWRYLGNKGEIQYANLSTGAYSILLKAASSNGTPSGNIITVNFVIHPPFWKTGWFILLSVVVFIILLIIVVRYVSRRNLKEKLLRLEKEQAVEKERNRISHDMHDDLGSGLTKIAIMSEVVKKQIHEPEKAKQQLDNISQSSRELVDNLQDIIWVLNPKNDTLESLAAYIREYALKFFDPFGIAVQFNYPDKFPDIKLSEETRRNIFLVIKETFNNTAKHAWSNKVKVSIEQTADGISIHITDDGKGFDMEQVRLFGNGLINMQTRARQIGGSYQIISSPGKGTHVRIEVPLESQ